MRSRTWPVVAAGFVGALITTALLVAIVRSDEVARADMPAAYQPLFQAGLAAAWWLPGAALAWWRPTLPFAWLAVGDSGRDFLES